LFKVGTVARKEPRKSWQRNKRPTVASGDPQDQAARRLRDEFAALSYSR
jgi:hypothetical protein